MRKYLLSETGNFYKANLHCHSVFSDGKLSPEALKQAYMNNGYSIIAYTDHNVLLDHSDLNDGSFLALNGIEIDVIESKYIPEVANKLRERKICHIGLIALEPGNITQPFYHRTKYLTAHQEEIGVREKIVYNTDLEDYEREYTPECICEIMQKAKDQGFFVTYNHPALSQENFDSYSRYKGMNAMEICNYGSFAAGYDDYNTKEYDDLLRQGKRIYCISTDDNHNEHPFTSPHCDSFGGFTVIKAEALEYKVVTDALAAGNFYASQGPEIYELYYEDGFIHVKTSPATKIFLGTGRRRTGKELAPKDSYITEAVFEVKEDDKYVRVTVVDENGLHANTNAYFTDELMVEA